MSIENILTLVMLFVLGAMMGSFVCCQVWRMHYQKQRKEKLGKRSVCLSCKKQLTWYENIPIVSWLALKGRCRSCKEKIGVMELWSELGLAVIFVAIGWKFLYQPVIYDVWNIVLMVLLLVILVLMWFLFLYDARWGQLPTKILVACIVLSLGYFIINMAIFGWKDIWGGLAGVVFLAGIYYLLYFFSREKLVGGGDWLLCLAIALLLGNWWLALIELLISNLLACIVMMATMKRLKGAMKVYFGPFLIVAFVIVFVAQTWLKTLVMMK